MINRPSLKMRIYQPQSLLRQAKICHIRERVIYTPLEARPLLVISLKDAIYTALFRIRHRRSLHHSPSWRRSSINALERMAFVMNRVAFFPRLDIYK